MILQQSLGKIWKRFDFAFHRVITWIFNLLYCMRPKYIKEHKDSKVLFLPLFGLIGDAVLFLDALKQYIKYAEEKNLTVLVGCRKPVILLYEAIGLSDNIIMVEMDRKRMLTDFKHFKSVVDQVNSYQVEMVIHTRARYTIEDQLIYAIRARKKIVFRNTSTKPKSLMKKYFFDNTYDMEIIAKRNMDQYQRFGMVLQSIGCKNYTSHVSRIPQLESNIRIEEKYVVICPSSSQKEKCWPAKRFAKVADYIIERYGYKICFVGGKGDKCYSDAVIFEMKNVVNVIDYTGKTAMNEWIEILRNAEFTISNDSASVHLSSAVQTTTFCIAPQHDGYRFLPYQPDEILEDDILPVAIRCSKMNCFDCQLENDKKKSQGDKLCKKSIIDTGCFKCINQISIEMAISEIVYFLRPKDKDMENSDSENKSN